MSTRLVVLVLDNTEHVRVVLDAWSSAGARGATILNSTGMRRVERGIRDDLPLFPSLEKLLEQDEMHHRTIFTIVEDDATVQRVVEATEAIIGDLEGENVGILFTIPVDFVRGIRRTSSA